MTVIDGRRDGQPCEVGIDTPTGIGVLTQSDHQLRDGTTDVAIAQELQCLGVHFLGPGLGVAVGGLDVLAGCAQVVDGHPRRPRAAIVHVEARRVEGIVSDVNAEASTVHVVEVERARAEHAVDVAAGIEAAEHDDRLGLHRSHDAGTARRQQCVLLSRKLGEVVQDAEHRRFGESADIDETVVVHGVHS